MPQKQARVSSSPHLLTGQFFNFFLFFICCCWDLALPMPFYSCWCSHIGSKDPFILKNDVKRNMCNQTLIFLTINNCRDSDQFHSEGGELFFHVPSSSLPTAKVKIAQNIALSYSYLSFSGEKCTQQQSYSPPFHVLSMHWSGLWLKAHLSALR